MTISSTQSPPRFAAVQNEPSTASSNGASATVSTASATASATSDSYQAAASNMSVVPVSNTTAASPSANANGDPTLQNQLQSSMTQARLGGSAQQAPASAAESNYEQMTSRLSYGATDWAVTNADVQAVHEQLDSLSNSDYRSSMERLDKDGYLDRYVSNMNSDARGAFLAQAADKGYVETRAGREYNVPSAQPKPPNSPALYRHREDLPSGVREAMHDENVSRFHEYKNDYREYVGAYSDKVMAAKNKDEIRAMGEPVRPNDQMEPGLSRNDPMKKRWVNDAIAYMPSVQPAYVAIGNRSNDLDGKIRPGSFYASGEVSWQQDDGSGDTQLGGKIGGRVYQYGAVEVEAAGTATNIMGTPLAGEAGVRGIHTPNGVNRVEPSLGAKAIVDFDSENSTIGRLVPLTAQMDQAGKVELGLEAVDIDTRYGQVGISSYASSDPSTNTIELGVAGDIGVGGGKVEVKAGVGMRLITADEIVEAMNSPGFFEE